MSGITQIDVTDAETCGLALAFYKLALDSPATPERPAFKSTPEGKLLSHDFVDMCVAILEDEDVECEMSVFKNVMEGAASLKEGPLKTSIQQICEFIFNLQITRILRGVELSKEIQARVAELKALDAAEAAAAGETVESGDDEKETLPMNKDDAEKLLDLMFGVDSAGPLPPDSIAFAFDKDGKMKKDTPSSKDAASKEKHDVAPSKEEEKDDVPQSLPLPSSDDGSLSKEEKDTPSSKDAAAKEEKNATASSKEEIESLPVGESPAEESVPVAQSK